MQNFQGIVLVPKQTYREIFESALVYLEENQAWSSLNEIRTFQKDI